MSPRGMVRIPENNHFALCDFGKQSARELGSNLSSYCPEENVRLRLEVELGVHVSGPRLDNGLRPHPDATASA